MRFKTPGFQKVFDAMLELAADPNSELYHNGVPRGGALQRCAFWDGYNGRRSPHAIPGTLGNVCIAAGREWARRTRNQLQLDKLP